jgi:hypothetical protein
MRRDFVLEKATKNTYRYTEVVDLETSTMCGVIYIQKNVLDSPPPQKITVTVDAS